MRRIIFALSLFVLTVSTAVTASAQKKREYYQITRYQFKTTAQEAAVDTYLKNAYLPALHKKGVSQVGVFKPIANDTAADKFIYVLTPLKDLQQLVKMNDDLLKDKQYLEAGKEYLNALYSDPPYTRTENIVLQAFELAPKMNLPKLNSPKQERIYELRSYESATEKLYRNKVEMFNLGGEIALFARLNFNAVFYGEVVAGSRMPNLMYLTSFENRADRDAHWKTFGQDPEWKKLSSDPKYQKNVSRSDIILMRAAEYSDY